jgi:hypothetical protein
MLQLQQHIPFEKKECALGECSAFYYEVFVLYLLKLFNLHDNTQRELVELCITLNCAELCDGLQQDKDC